MHKRIFLTGPAGCGKSRLIREALGGRLAMVGGFMTGPVHGPDGYAKGYALRPAAACAGVEGLACPVFLDAGVWPPVRDNEVFRVYGTRLLREALWYPCAVLDELGGFELLIPQFRAALEELLGSGLPLLGTVKTAEDAEAWRQLFGLGERFTQHAAQFRAMLSADENTLILDLSCCSEADARRALGDWADAFIGNPPGGLAK